MKKRRLFMLMMMAAGFLLTLEHVNSLALPLEMSRKPTVEKATETHGIVPGRMRVTFINPGISDPIDPTGGFWLSVSSFMRAAAEQLDIDLEIIYSERDHIRMQQQAREVAERSVLPDYLIVVNEKLAADEMVKTADRAGLKVFVMLNSFESDQAEEMGPPRKKYKNWIGSLLPDNNIAGSLVTQQIIDEATRRSASWNGRLKLFAIAGDPVTQASVQRVEGLRKTVSEYAGVELQQVFIGEWRQDIARQQTQIALLRYPETRAIWAANDPMAEGAIEGALEEKRQPGKDIFIGGVNWDAPALTRIKNGSLAVSVGGHFMTGGWTLVLLYDYHHGRDFADEGPALQRQIFGILNRNNIDVFLNKFGDRNWNKVDFSRFSKVLNPSLTKYDFSTEAVIEQ
jgi:ABC-type sugar transport system substrate-binding protein